MSTDLDTPLPDTPWWRTYQGRFKGILTWQAFDRLWARLAEAPEGWYAYELSGSCPEAPLSAEAFQALLDEANDMYAIARKQSFCGAVYVDDPESPSFIKVFDPNNMGAVCGDSGKRTLPRWVLSRARPDPLPPAPEAPARKGLISRLIG